MKAKEMFIYSKGKEFGQRIISRIKRENAAIYSLFSGYL
jgi:hypothetical protein